MQSRHSSAPSTSKLNQLFDVYKGAQSVTIVARALTLCPPDADGEDITVNGTIKLCEDLGVDPEDVVLLAIAYELKSPSMGEWNRKGWVDGWKSIG